MRRLEHTTDRTDTAARLTYSTARDKVSHRIQSLSDFIIESCLLFAVTDSGEISIIAIAFVLNACAHSLTFFQAENILIL